MSLPVVCYARHKFALLSILVRFHIASFRLTVFVTTVFVTTVFVTIVFVTTVFDKAVFVTTFFVTRHVFVTTILGTVRFVHNHGGGTPEVNLRGGLNVRRCFRGPSKLRTTNSRYLYKDHYDKKEAGS